MAKEAKLKIFKVTHANADEGTQTDEGATRVRLIRADRRAAVESFLLSEVTIDVATQEDCFALSRNGVDIEEAKGE